MRALGPHPGRGSKLGRYTLSRKIGAGGMATVYQALDPHGDTYAVKVLNPSAVLEEDAKRFQREFKTLEKMDHPNVVRVYEAGVTGGYPWIAMEYVDGQDLEGLIAEWKEERDPARFDEIERILRGLCSALQYVHDRKLIHRDIKPSNVLVTAAGETKLSDFGVVKGRADNTSHITQLTMAGRLVGTVAFMAPELITTDDAVDQRADLYSLGAMLYLMLTFRRPIEADSVAGYLARHLTEIPVSPGELDPDVPRSLERICNRLLLKDRAYRYSSANAVLSALSLDGDDEPLPIRGRDRQLQGWSRRVEALLEGAGGCVIISGMSGTGKTLLLSSMVEHARNTRAGCVAALDWEDDPLDELARQAGLDPEGSLGTALTRAIVAQLGQAPAIIAVDRLDEAPKRTIDSLSRLLRDRCSLEGEPLLLVATARSLDAIANLVNGHTTGMPADLVPTGAIDVRAAVAMLRDRGVPGAAAGVLGRRLFEEYSGQPGPIVRQLETLVEMGWFTGSGELRLAVDSRQLRKGELPVPPSLSHEVLEQLDQVSSDERHAAELLAVLERGASPSFVGRCTGDVHGAARALEALVGAGLLIPEEGDTFRFLRPSIGRVIRQHLAPEVRAALHESVAKALGARRRRSNALEVATHLHQAGKLAEAYPLYVAAARREARAGDLAAVQEITERAASIRLQVEEQLESEQALSLRRQLLLLRGESALQARDPDGARKALEGALNAARDEGDVPAIGRALGGLGRALHQLGRYDRAEPVLAEALEKLDPGAPERGAVLRASGDLALFLGDTSTAVDRFEEALELAEGAGSRDGEARARRGLAHVRAFQGRLEDCRDLLDEADDLLSLDGDPHVRAGVLARSIEVHALLGRWGGAVRRAENLVDLARRRELAERLPDAYSLLAQVLVAIGATDDAYDAAAQAKVFARAHPGRLAPRLRLVRALLDLERFEEAAGLLPASEELSRDRVEDLPAQHAALKARLLARTDRNAAHDQAVWALTRDPPLLSYVSAYVARDASLALGAAGHEKTARTAAKRGLKQLKGLGCDGLRLEMLIAMHGASPDARVLEAIGQVAARIETQLPVAARERFLHRTLVAEARRHG